MNTRLSSIALALIATTTSAYAAEIQPQEWVEFSNVATGKTRDQVRAELVQAQQQPKALVNTGEYVEPAPVASTRTREQVRAELEQAYAEGKLASPEFVEFTHVASTRTRQEVQEEAVRAARAAHSNSQVEHSSGS